MSTEKIGMYIASRSPQVLTGTELVPVIVSDVTYQATTQAIANLAPPPEGFVGARYNLTSGTPQSVANNTTTRINFSNQSWDTGGLVTTGSSWKFTAPQTGKYLVNCNISIPYVPWIAQNYLQSNLYWNTAGSIAILSFQQVLVTASSGFFLVGAVQVLLNADDYVYAVIWQNSGNTISLTVGDIDICLLK